MGGPSTSSRRRRHPAPASTTGWTGWPAPSARASSAAAAPLRQSVCFADAQDPQGDACVLAAAASPSEQRCTAFWETAPIASAGQFFFCMELLLALLLS